MGQTGKTSLQRRPSHPFRVFVSYSSDDETLAREVVETLRQMGLRPVWDKDIPPGTPFAHAITGLMSRCHVFMPLLTEKSQNRPWVNQEIGYAKALNLPVLPLAVGVLPGQIIAPLQAITVNDIADLPHKLASDHIKDVVLSKPSTHDAVFEVVFWPERRTELMTTYADRVKALEGHGRVFQRGGLSSFSIPDRAPHDKIWAERDGNLKRQMLYHELQRQERRALEGHARTRGCWLVIDPTMEFTEVGGPSVRRARLKVLLDFLEHMPDDKVRIVISRKAREGNLTIVGDWFLAESLVPRAGEGYYQTVFIWHAPTVLRAVGDFTDEFNELYKSTGLGPYESRKVVIEEITKILKSLPPAQP